MDLDTLTLEELYAAVPTRNESAKEATLRDGLVLEVPLKEPRGGLRVLSWFMPMQSHHRVHLDGPGKMVFELCDGKENVQDIIRRFGDRFKLTFHESRLSVTLFLKKLMERGVVAMALKEAEERPCRNCPGGGETV